MADEDLRALERSWAEGAGDLASGDAFFRALERAGADTGRLLEVRLQVLRAHVSAAGLDPRSVSPMPEVDPLAASLVVPGERAISSWHALKARAATTGFYPVLIGSAAEFERTIELLNDLGAWSPREVIDRATRFQVPMPAARDLEAREHLWPTYPIASAQLSMSSPTVSVALIPSPTPWHAAAYLRFGGIMDSFWPDPVEHVARHRRWFEVYGAEPAVMAPWSQLLDMWVVRPPRAQPEALALAGEHALYCQAMRDEAAGMLEYLAARLLSSTAWSFRW